MFAQSLKRFEKLILYLLLIMLPTQIAYHFWPTWSFVFGIRVDFLAPSIYVTDLLVGLLFLIDIFTSFKKYLTHINKHKTVIGFLLAFLFINCIFSISPLESIYKWIKTLEFIFLGFYFFKQEIVKYQVIVGTILVSSVVVSLIGISQLVYGGTLGGILYFLGERTFNVNTPGIALVVLNGVEHMRAYSIFSHPNSLAGYLGIIILITVLDERIKKTKLVLAALVIDLICFILTFSVSSYISILVTIIIYFVIKRPKDLKLFKSSILIASIFLSLLTPLVAQTVLGKYPTVSQNISQRLDLSVISGRLIGENILIGQGLGVFPSTSRYLQPVHNIYLLVLTEVGTFGLLVFCYFLFKIFKYNPLLFTFILITSLTDHYWLTIQQNLLLLSILVGISIKITSWRK